MTCSLCESPDLEIKTLGSKRYFQCLRCELLKLDPSHHLSVSEERRRYEEHQNDVHDHRYQAFVSPLIDEVKRSFPVGSLGLDFGAGTGPVIAHLLESHGYKVSKYDPYFWPDQETLKERYDFICTCEVVEHFYHPRVEFQRLRGLLKPGGRLGIMTLLHSPKVDLSSWYYLRDPTHVSLYSEATFSWIAKAWGFEKPQFVNNRVIWLTASSSYELTMQ